MFKKTVILLFGFSGFLLKAQEPFPKNYFRSPIDTTIILAGNFGELRTNHFHAGIDIKTGNKEGMPVHAVAEGYVSRIKVSSFGYGKVIYLTHPNGFVSVYGHLRSFNDTLNAFIKKNQYEKKSFEIELFPKPGDFQVKKGELIAYSGNTGLTAGPHLHFKIRDEKTEKAINPLLFGIPVKDTRKPQVKTIKISPLDESGLVNGINKAAEYPVLATKKGYMPDTKAPIKVSGKIGFGLEAFDTESSAGGRNGVYSIELQLNHHRIYSHEMDEIGFDESRAINSFIDYPENLKTGKYIQRLFVEENNPLHIYKDVVNKGIVYFNSDSTYTLRFILKDVSGNTSELEFPVKSSLNKIRTNSSDFGPFITFHCREKNNYAVTDFKLEIPPNNLYSDIHFNYYSSPAKSKGFYSPIHHVHDPDVPLHDYMQISIKPRGYSDSLKKHLFIAKLGKNGVKEYIGGVWENDFITAKTSSFGDYVVAADTTPPLMVNISRQKTLEFKISDNFSGVGSYNACIDGNWILMEYEYKQHKLFYRMDESKAYSPFNPKSKTHLFKLVVTDRAGNARTFVADCFEP